VGSQGDTRDRKPTATKKIGSKAEQEEDSLEKSLAAIAKEV
jgi:hypothetical protein